MKACIFSEKVWNLLPSCKTVRKAEHALSRFVEPPHPYSACFWEIIGIWVQIEHDRDWFLLEANISCSWKALWVCPKISDSTPRPMYTWNMETKVLWSSKCSLNEWKLNTSFFASYNNISNIKKAPDLFICLMYPPFLVMNTISDWNFRFIYYHSPDISENIWIYNIVLFSYRATTDFRISLPLKKSESSLTLKVSILSKKWY